MACNDRGINHYRYVADAASIRAAPQRRPLCDLCDSVFLHQEFDMELHELSQTIIGDEVAGVRIMVKGY